MRLDALLSPEGWVYASSGTGRFHCLFGRDSLITALQVLPARPAVARATLDALAARQGVRHDPLTLEEPGKIGHEFRESPPPSFVAAGWPVGGPFAYYGTAGNKALGVLGEGSPDTMLPRLRKAATGFGGDRKVQVAYELIATVAQAKPGPDGDYSRMIDEKQIQRYVDHARKNKALIILDLQPGRGSFLPQAKAMERFLVQPHVGLALDPEWRMPKGKVPGRTIGQVSPAEVNQEVDDAPVEKRHAIFHAVGHRHLVLADQKINQVGLHLVLDAVADMIGLPLVEHRAAANHHLFEICLRPEADHLVGALEQRRRDERIDRVTAELALETMGDVRRHLQQW